MKSAQIKGKEVGGDINRQLTFLASNRMRRVHSPNWVKYNQHTTSSQYFNNNWIVPLMLHVWKDWYVDMTWPIID